MEKEMITLRSDLNVMVRLKGLEGEGRPKWSTLLNPQSSE